MKILWVVNIPLPQASRLMNEKPLPLGGWLINSSKNLSEYPNIQLHIAFPKDKVEKYKILKDEKITYYAFKLVKDKDKKLIQHNPILQEIVKEIQPDIVHIYGTELAHTLSMVNVCNKEKIKTVISIQGLVSIIAKHLYSNLPWKVVYGTTIRNILLRDNVRGLKKIYTKRGKNEIEAIRQVKHVIGRTMWDKACSTQINPSVNYHFCNETLRTEFYKHKWDINKCEKYSIFVSQANYPIKGFHYILEAMPFILDKFPTAKIYISGKNITKSDTIKDKLLMTYYGRYIKKLIKKYKLEEYISFVGNLNEKEICNRYLQSHVFVSASSIENESNSVSEAKILGVPCIASYVGGVVDRINHGIDGYLYQHDAPYMLANYVCKIFENDKLALEFSNNAQNNAIEIYDEQANTQNMIKIYESIINN